jgi:hypothetical protein
LPQLFELLKEMTTDRPNYKEILTKLLEATTMRQKILNTAFIKIFNDSEINPFIGKQRFTAALAAFPCYFTYLTNVSFLFFLVCCDETA